MQTSKQWLADVPIAPTGRTVLCVDRDETCAGMLQDAWMQLRFADHLHIVPSQEEASAFLCSVDVQGGPAPLAAVILDPEATGEATGAFVRQVRTHCGKDMVPIMLWSRESRTYKVLEGRSVESVLSKPMVLRLIQSLDAACDLRIQHFKPFTGNRMFTHPAVGMLTNSTPSLWPLAGGLTKNA